ncbi:hypothetical protein V6N13_138607 [Hibiscus sabdariffa]
MEVAIRAGGSKNCSFAAVRDHISLALGPAVVLDSIRELEKVTIQGATQFLEDNFVADDRYILNVKRSVGIASNWGVSSFLQTANNSRILSFLQFRMSIAESKKGPTKLCVY